MLRALAAAVLLLALAWSPDRALADPIIVAGFGDSITSTTFDGPGLGSYLEFLPAPFTYEDYGTPAIEAGDLYYDVVSYINGAPTADVIVLMTGTPDTFWPDYSQAATVTSIQSMVDYVLDNSDLDLILMAPPPAVPPCDNVEFVTGGAVTCDAVPADPDVDMIARLEALSGVLASLAPSDSGNLDRFGFLDVHQIFEDAPGGPAAYMKPDGVHPTSDGDVLIADALTPTLLLIPEPGTGLLLALGLVGLAGAGRAQRGSREHPPA
jgi:lysophospholipase L1-like esterase